MSDKITQIREAYQLEMEILFGKKKQLEIENEKLKLRIKELEEQKA